MSRIRLMTYNVHRCQGIDGRIAPERIADVIRRAEPDIVALQEMDVRRARTNDVDQPDLLAELLEMNYLFYPTMRLSRGAYGTAVLSRWPLEAVRSAPLPTLSDRTIENRGALRVSVHVGDRTLQVINTHLGLARGERRLQAASLLGPDWLTSPLCTEPRVLCGDFNMSRRGEYSCFDGVWVRSTWEEAGPPPRTWPSLLPILTLDHIFLSPGVELEGLEAPSRGAARWASDHRPVVATFRV
jgi:endonuclease/exonuclease/phosphatase family metal-dependent hydrolase